MSLEADTPEEATTTISRLPAIVSLHREAMADRQAHASELANYRGKSLSIEAIPMVLPGRESKEGVLIVIHDLTEIRRLEQVRRDFVANVSHELKTPLTSIKGYVETLKEGAMDDLGVRGSFLDKIKANSAQAKASSSATRTPMSRRSTTS